MPQDRTRFYSQVIDGQSVVEGVGYRRALFKNCHFVRLRESVLTHCTMINCKLDPVDIRDILGMTVTLNCHTWDHLQASPLALDAILFLITRGAAEKDQQRIRSVIEPQRIKLFTKIFPLLEPTPFGDGIEGDLG